MRSLRHIVKFLQMDLADTTRKIMLMLCLEAVRLFPDHSLPLSVLSLRLLNECLSGQQLVIVGG